jgi:hypothetical protein
VRVVKLGARLPNPPARLRCWLVLAALLPAAPGGAHVETVPTLVNRYITVTTFETRVDVLVSLLFGHLPARERRRQIDADGDGRIDERELARERLAWGRDPDKLVLLTLDGSPVRLRAACTLDLNGDRTVAAKPLLVELHGSFDIAPGERRLRLVAGPDLPRMGETDIAIDLATGWELQGTLDAAEHATPTPQRMLQFAAAPAGDRPPVAVTFLLRARPTTDGTRAGGPWGSTAWGLVAAAVAATLALVVLALRSRKAGDRAT